MKDKTNKQTNLWFVDLFKSGVKWYGGWGARQFIQTCNKQNWKFLNFDEENIWSYDSYDVEFCWTKH